MKNHHTVFHSSYIILFSHYQSRRAPISPHSCHHLFSILFSAVAILIGVRWFLTVLICISPVISDVHNLFMCLLAIFISSMKKCIRILCQFLNQAVCFLLLNFRSSLCILDIDLYQIYDLNIFSPILPFCGLPFYSVDSFLMDKF